jgi:hypothetical protein
MPYLWCTHVARRASVTWSKSTTMLIAAGRGPGPVGLGPALGKCHLTHVKVLATNAGPMLAYVTQRAQ